MREADLRGSIENRSEADTQDNDALLQISSEDNQLYEALTLLKGINVYQASTQRLSGASGIVETEETSIE